MAAQDLRETDLNGPEFVGTPEYMAPEMINGDPPTCHTADLWTIGVIIFQVVFAGALRSCLLVCANPAPAYRLALQLLSGSSPFKSPSPYLAFLKIKRANLRIPAVGRQPWTRRAPR